MKSYDTYFNQLFESAYIFLLTSLDGISIGNGKSIFIALKYLNNPNQP